MVQHNFKLFCLAAIILNSTVSVQPATDSTKESPRGNGRTLAKKIDRLQRSNTVNVIDNGIHNIVEKANTLTSRAKEIQDQMKKKREEEKLTKKPNPVYKGLIEPTVVVGKVGFDIAKEKGDKLRRNFNKEYKNVVASSGNSFRDEWTHLNKVGSQIKVPFHLIRAVTNVALKRTGSSEKSDKNKNESESGSKMKTQEKP